MLNQASLMLLAAAGLFLAGAWLLWHAGQRRQQGVARARLEFLTDRLPRLVDRRNPDARYGFASLRFIGRGLYRAGLTLSARTHDALMAIPVAMVPLTIVMAGWSWAVALLLLYLTALYLYLLWRIGRFRRALVEQLPGFLDSISRSLAVGNTMTVAINLSIEKTPDPARRVFDQVLRRHELGASVEDSLTQVARSYQIRELSLLASVVSTNSRYGGKVEPVLSNIAATIREAERARHELYALTAETRFSAWLLSALPVGVAVMMLISNPAYLRGMWLDETGRWMLLAGFGLEAAGTLLLLRMARI